MSRRQDILPALRAACHDAVAEFPRAFVRRHLDAGDWRCARIGATTAEVSAKAGWSLERTRRALVARLGRGEVFAEQRANRLRWWPRGMAGELWESRGP